MSKDSVRGESSGHRMQIVNSQDMPVDIIMPRRHFVHKMFKSVTFADSRLCRLLAEATLAGAFALRSHGSIEY